MRPPRFDGVLFNRDERFVAELGGAIARVYQLITAYNAALTDEKKQGILSSIETTIKSLTYKYPASYFAASPGYRAFADELFTTIQLERQRMVPPVIGGNSSDLDKLIQNMSPAKANELLSILVDKDHWHTRLPKLYSTDDRSLEAANFNTFIRTHEITYLGGNNSNNYKIIKKSDRSEAVLKVDNRLGNPRWAEMRLRSNPLTQGLFTPIAADRLVTGTSPLNEVYCRSLQVTELRRSADLMRQSSIVRGHPELADHACNVFQQMANVFLNIQEAHCFFPDAKLSNWMVDSAGKLRMADTKSFLVTDPLGGSEHGTISYNKIQQQNGAFISTPGISPPEYNILRAHPQYPFNVDNMHAFMLGKNLYEYVTGKRLTAMDVDGSKFDFSDPIFRTQKGARLMGLIKSLVIVNPADRMPLRDALRELQAIERLNVTAMYRDRVSHQPPQAAMSPPPDPMPRGRRP